jgi:hypothetical protein
MAIQQVERAARIDAGLRVERSPGERRPAVREDVDPDARVELSPQAERMRAQRSILRAVFGGVESDADADAQALFEEAGRSEYLDAIAQPSDLSPQATAQRILGGITGYIYGAFRLAHPDATVEDFDRFAADVVRGFEKGLGEARSIIEGLAAFTPELASGIERTEGLVREGLDVFFSDERRRLERARAVEQ